jgi:pilus assembly protein TadC
VACALAAVSAFVAIGGRLGVVVAVAALLCGPGLLAGREAGAWRDERRQVAADLPLALDLLAACLIGGAGAPDALRAVASATGSALAERLRLVAAHWELGAPPAQAWAALEATGAPGPPGLRSVGEAEAVVAAAVRLLARAAADGTPVADAVSALAEELRKDARARGDRAAARAEVLVVGPLGLCFLPAFVLIGIVPVVVALLGPALSAV